VYAVALLKEMREQGVVSYEVEAAPAVVEKAIRAGFQAAIKFHADRGNKRLQYFTLDGKHVKFVEGVSMPCHFSERQGVMVIPDLAARVTLIDRDNRVIGHLGDDSESDWRKTRVKSRDAFVPGKFVCPHGACFDHAGNIFVVEWVEVGRVTKLRKV
jgi:hypothetical protein